jgi:hypothetical protein
LVLEVLALEVLEPALDVVLVLEVPALEVLKLGLEVLLFEYVL